MKYKKTKFQKGLTTEYRKNDRLSDQDGSQLRQEANLNKRKRDFLINFGKNFGKNSAIFVQIYLLDTYNFLISTQVRLSTQSEQPPTRMILHLNKHPECLIGPFQPCQNENS